MNILASTPCAPHNSSATTASPAALATLRSARKSAWAVPMTIRAEIEFPAQDADSPEDADRVAREIAAANELRVTVGGVLIPAEFAQPDQS